MLIRARPWEIECDTGIFEERFSLSNSYAFADKAAIIQEFEKFIKILADDPLLDAHQSVSEVLSIDKNINPDSE